MLVTCVKLLLVPLICGCGGFLTDDLSILWIQTERGSSSERGTVEDSIVHMQRRLEVHVRLRNQFAIFAKAAFFPR